MGTFLLVLIFLIVGYGSSILGCWMLDSDIGWIFGAVIGLLVVVLFAYSEIKSRLDTVISNQNEMKKSLELKQNNKTDGADKAE